MRDGESPPHYRKALGATELVWLGVGGTIGSGIFVVPGSAAALVGPSAWLAWVAVAVSASAVAFALAELEARAAPGAPLTQLLANVFGPRTAAAVVVLYSVASIIGVATIAAGLAQYFDYVGMHATTAWAAFAVVVVLAVNLAGIAPSSLAENGLSILKVLGIGFLILVLAPHVEPARLAPRPLPDGAAFVQAIVLVYWSFTGFEISAVPSAEARDPGAIRSALFRVMALVCVVYIALNVALLGSVGATALARSSAPLADAIAAHFAAAGPIVAVLGIVTMLSALNAYVIGASRALQNVGEAMRLDALARLSRRGVPWAALTLTCGAALPALYAGHGFDALATASVVMTLVPYVALCVASALTAPALRARVVGWFGAAATIAILVAWAAIG